MRRFACHTHSPAAVLVLLDPFRAHAAAFGRISPSLHRAKNKKIIKKEKEKGKEKINSARLRPARLTCPSSDADIKLYLEYYIRLFLSTCKFTSIFHVKIKSSSVQDQTGLQMKWYSDISLYLCSYRFPVILPPSGRDPPAVPCGTHHTGSPGTCPSAKIPVQRHSAPG